MTDSCTFMKLAVGNSSAMNSAYNVTRRCGTHVGRSMTTHSDIHMTGNASNVQSYTIRCGLTRTVATMRNAIFMRRDQLEAQARTVRATTPAQAHIHNGNSRTVGKSTSTARNE